MKQGKFTVAKKLYIGFISVLLIMGILGWVSISNMLSMNDKTKEIANNWLPGTATINNINYLTEHITALEYEYLLKPNSLELKKLEEEMNNTFSEIDTSFDYYEKTITLEEDRKNFDALKEKWRNYQVIHSEFMELGTSVNIINGADNNNVTKLNSILNEGSILFSDMQIYLENLLELNKNQALQSRDDSSELFTTSFKLTLIYLAVGVILGLTIAFVVSRMISRPLEMITKNAKEIANGNLAIEEIKIKNRDEIGQVASSFNQMAENLRAIIHEINLTSEQVASSSEELMASTEETTSATKQVVTSIQEVASSVEVQGENTEESARSIGEISIGVQSIAESTSVIAESTMETTTQANTGNVNIQKVVGQMKLIYGASRDTITVMEALESRSKGIGQIIEVITGIAEQTNLLALNAAIESARAGEHGKGFAVVAEEVRKLAESSKVSANQIAEIIKLIQMDTMKAVEMTNTGNKEVQNGLNLAEETGKTFNQILKSIEGVSAQAQELSAISEEMSASVEQVNASIEEVAQLAKVSSGNATEIAAASEEQLATLEEVTSSASSLADLAEKLRELVRKFKL
ncbi:methyl-accepting chemotaxis protein [Peribacillus loiseleuriae]|uniref:Chemotaxis protein n=1 Tax=Peribacillus loiseleuriae TaxID=1679170 RepID=A0A0K9GSI9_9BACI|nr:methyl-accepting chemotaxis protein [Peribacillus loiseleuriae]KMY49595.1 hypothetical protein AC625_08610 [Peribacillus loiseleuriae]